MENSVNVAIENGEIVRTINIESSPNLKSFRIESNKKDFNILLSKKNKRTVLQLGEIKLTSFEFDLFKKFINQKI